jgi:hypothetical protein
MIGGYAPRPAASPQVSLAEPHSVQLVLGPTESLVLPMQTTSHVQYNSIDGRNNYRKVRSVFWRWS